MKNTLFSARNRAIFGLFLCAFLMAGFSFAQVSVTPAPFVKPQYFNGTVPCNACLLYTYAAGTTTPLVSYTDSTGVTPNADPVVLDSSGYASVWIGPSAYKFVLKTSAGVTIWTMDGINGGYVSFLSLNGGNALTAIADPAASLGKFWLSSTLAGRIKWSDATTLHTITGNDTVDTFTGVKTFTAIPVFSSGISGTAGQTLALPSTADTLVGRGTADTLSGIKTFSVQPLNSQNGNITGIMTGTCSGTASASTTLALFPLGEISALTCTVAPLAGNGAGAVNTTAGTIKNLQVVCGTGGVNASSGAFTVIKNLVATALTCTVGASTSCADSTHSFTSAVGDRIGIQFTTQALETLANCSASIERF